jgi:hypothetical protein
MVSPQAARITIRAPHRSDSHDFLAAVRRSWRWREHQRCALVKGH